MNEELRTHEFNRLIDQYLTTATMSEEDYHKLTQLQREVVQTLKRAFKRINSR